MSNKQYFIEMVSQLIANSTQMLDGRAMQYWAKFQSEEDKPIVLTDNGKVILQILQQNPEKAFYSREIAEELFLQPRSVPGIMRKLIADGLVESESAGENSPKKYKITNAGIIFKIDN